MFGTLPIHIALIFVIFVCASGIAFIIGHIYRWRQGKKAKDMEGLQKARIHSNCLSDMFINMSPDQIASFLHELRDYDATRMALLSKWLVSGCLDDEDDN